VRVPAAVTAAGKELKEKKYRIDNTTYFDNGFFLRGRWLNGRIAAASLFCC